MYINIGINNQLVILMNTLIQKSSIIDNDNSNNSMEFTFQIDLLIQFLTTIQKANELDVLSIIDSSQLGTTMKILEQTLMKLIEIELTKDLENIKSIKDDTALLNKIENQVVSTISIIHKSLRLISKIYAIYSIDYAKEKVYIYKLYLNNNE